MIMKMRGRIKLERQRLYRERCKLQYTQIELDLVSYNLCLFTSNTLNAACKRFGLLKLIPLPSRSTGDKFHLIFRLACFLVWTGHEMSVSAALVHSCATVFESAQC